MDGGLGTTSRLLACRRGPRRIRPNRSTDPGPQTKRAIVHRGKKWVKKSLSLEWFACGIIKLLLNLIHDKAKPLFDFCTLGKLAVIVSVEAIDRALAAFSYTVEDED